jgi:uncharacterized protein YjbI with pentapeptide repeats
MANEEHLTLLKQGVDAWNEWRCRNPTVYPDLHGAILHGANLVQADLTETDLARAFLQDANLNRANLAQANLAQANLSQANLTEIDLTGALLQEANLNRANLNRANLTDANLIEANLALANLDEANLSRALLGGTILGNVFNLDKVHGLDTCFHYSPSLIDVRTLIRTENFPISFLRGCGFSDDFINYLPSQYYSCCISYSREDQLFVDKLHADLQNAGVRCWIAPHDRSGAKTSDAIDNAVKLRDKLLVVLSAASLGSDWVEDEVSKAYAEERSRDTTVLFPVRIDDVVPWASKLRDQRNIGDFRMWENAAQYVKSFERLLRALKITTTGPG